MNKIISYDHFLNKQRKFKFFFEMHNAHRIETGEWRNVIGFYLFSFLVFYVLWICSWWNLFRFNFANMFKCSKIKFEYESLHTTMFIWTLNIDIKFSVCSLYEIIRKCLVNSNFEHVFCVKALFVSLGSDWHDLLVIQRDRDIHAFYKTNKYKRFCIHFFFFDNFGPH